LESYELCCLVETFPNNHKDLQDFKETLKAAYLYAKTVTLGTPQKKKKFPAVIFLVVSSLT
jgi:hypothetical protein